MNYNKNNCSVTLNEMYKLLRVNYVIFRHLARKYEDLLNFGMYLYYCRLAKLQYSSMLMCKNPKQFI